MTSDSYRVILTASYTEGRIVAATGPCTKEAAMKGFNGFVADGGFGPQSRCRCKVMSEYEWVMSRLVAGAV